jgi:predicted metalloprotease with PDZ domain
LNLESLSNIVSPMDKQCGLSSGAKTIVSLLAITIATFTASAEPITLHVDATDAPRNLLHAQMHIPVTPGKCTLYYPKWIPGEHAPSGPINNLTGLIITANGKPLKWERDIEDMFTFHLDVPTNVTAVNVSLDFLPSAGGGNFSSGGSSTARLLDLNWNQLLLYPKSAEPLKTEVTASLRLPSGWQYGTALPVESAAGDSIRFRTATLETLIDSPVIAGKYFRTLDLTPGEQPAHYLHFVADSAEDLEIKPEDIARFTRLVHEANALFGAHHYRDYHFLATLSDHVEHFGLEHHESSDDRISADFLTDEDCRAFEADLLPHEMVHSWNGKYRRPAGLATPDYQQPMNDELLWVYEGLTDYLGKVLAARSGLATPTNFCGGFAFVAAKLDHRDGRNWRSLADTTVAAQLLYSSPDVGISRRRSVDFYPEGDLIWLEADTIIRQQTHGKKSLDDFCRRFYGGESGAPKVVPYTFDDVIQALNATVPYDWKNFFQQRIYQVTPRAPLGGIENGGWQLVYTNEVPPLQKIFEGQRKFTDLNYSLGFGLDKDGGIGDVLPRSPADRAGLDQGMKLIAVNGRAWSTKLLREAIAAGVTNIAPLQLLVQNDDYYNTYSVDYHGGEKYATLQRNPAKPDLISAIIKPLTPEPSTNSPSAK